jgi:hypothetical protein
VPFTPQNTALLENQADLQPFKKVPVMRLGVFMTTKFHIVVLRVIRTHNELAGTNVCSNLWYPPTRPHGTTAKKTTAAVHKYQVSGHADNQIWFSDTSYLWVLNMELASCNSSEM